VSCDEQFFEVGVTLSEMLDPDRSVNKNHAWRLATLSLLRGTDRINFSVPPSVASLFPLSMAINASNPAFTRDVFSVIPESSDALFSRSSSMFKVVLICISMHS